MSFVGWFGFLALALTWGAQLYLRSLFVREGGSSQRTHPSLQTSNRSKSEVRMRYRKLLHRLVVVVWIVSIVALFTTVAVQSYLQYQEWQVHPIGQYLIPPHQSATYFYFFAGKRFAANVLIALAAAILFGWLAFALNRKLGRKFLEDEEARLFALAIFLTGYPGFLFYIVFMLLAAVLLSLVYTLMDKGRAPLYFAWLPTAIFAILVVELWLPHQLLSIFIF